METLSPRFLELDRLSEDERAALLRRADHDIEPVLERARPIVEAVRQEGDAALRRFARELDGVEGELGSLIATAQEIERAYAALGSELVEAIRFAIANIKAFHERQKPEPMWLHEIRPGAFAGDRWTPIPSVALYVPRGKGAFPSVTMMTSVPAIVAGVPEITILTPPTPEGGVDAATLVAANEAGVRRIVKAGGAQAVAAAAFGTESVPRCAKIVGPGSPWVVAAKRLVAHRIDTGPPAGPSESIVFADETADPELAAADLLIEAEHGPDSSAYLVTPSRRVAEGARAALPRRWAELPEPRRSFTRAVLEGPRGGILLAPSLEAARAFVNAYAPEHLEVLSAEPWAHLAGLDNAAEILMGPWTPITLGNFVLGPNCVLPTGGWARSFGPLAVTDFMKRSSIGYVTAGAYPALARPAMVLAEYEGFPAHAAALRARGGEGRS
ncbi:MAG: histidinol dehydrogenase [Geminicoccaceae bacterium]|nr:histidinol dehydrogenase [Geminicoccaceae bacterium]